MIGVILALTAMVLIGAGAVGLSLGKRRAVEDALRVVAHRRGGEVTRANAFGGPSWRLTNERWALKLTLRSDDSDDSVTRLVLTPFEPLDLTIGRERSKWDLRRMMGVTDIQVGDPTFDDQFFLAAADEAELVSRLPNAAREAAWNAVVGQGARLSKGAFQLDLKGWTTDAATLSEGVDSLTAFADTVLDHPGRNAEALLKHAITEPDAEPGYRHRCMELLLRDYPRSEAGQAALEQAPSAVDPGIRFLVARHAGDHGTIRALLREGLPPKYRDDAMALLGPEHGGGLALADGGGGELAVVGEAGRLSEAEAQEPARRPKVKA